MYGLMIKTLPLRSLGPLEKGNSETDPIRQHALEALRPCLPVSLPIYRRLQFGRFFEATSLLTNLPLDNESPAREHKDESIARSSRTSADPWLIAFVDRSCRPETEVWLYCSWESRSQDRAVPAGGKEDILTKALVHAMRALQIPDSIHQDILDAKSAKLENGTKDSAGLSRDDYAAHMLDPDIMLWGSVHEATVPILQRLGVAGGEKFKAAVTPNLTFMWDVDSLARSKDLPEGLRWGELKAEHFPLVRSRTAIPRQDRTLAVLPNLGIFPAGAGESDPAPVAWVFVGLDGSLTTLHVESEWRGRGLAKAITTKLFRQKMGLFWEEGLTKWAHGNVIRGNKESEGMCRSLGGQSNWDVFWVRVDLNAT